MNFSRLTSLIGIENLNKLQNSTIAIIGLGGVGATTALSLARNGIGKFIIQDFDIVEESNINRQVIANYSTIGIAKTTLVFEEIKKINPNAEVIVLTERFDEKSSLFENKFDFLVDAIDDVDSKVLLIKRTIEEKIAFISAMGAAKKLDPTKIVITELAKTTYDPLAKTLRKKLRDLKINEKVMVASSTEQAKEGIELGSYMPVTATMGLYLADYVIKFIIKE